jgi:ABC-type uncharacterized transport system permease subunit
MDIMHVLKGVFSISILARTLSLSTPLIFAALGGMYSERSGVINIALEGKMLMGAFVAVVVSYFTKSPWLGILAATLTGGVVGLLHAWLCIDLKANHVVSGTAINITAVGLTNVLIIAVWHQPGASPLVDRIHPIQVPLLSSIPVVGQLFASQNLLSYVALALVPISYHLLFRTPWGLRVRSVGEHPLAADTVGVKVRLMRYMAVSIAGMLGGIGGAYLSVAALGVFTKQMTAGRGFIALGAMIFGKWRPWGLLGACLLFGFADALQLVLQAQGVPIPTQFLMALPYVFTMIALAGFVGKAVAPAAIGESYEVG